MVTNLEFYGITAVIGFVFSLAAFKDRTIETWLIWTVVLFPFCWATTGLLFSSLLNDEKGSSAQSLIRYFDASEFSAEPQSLRAFGVVALITAVYFALVFSLGWRIKNRLTTK